MGVKDLWTIVSPICERKPLWEFQDNCIAIDLSCWICDSQNVTDNRAQPNMYLRNLFFRISYLLLHGILPIFILEGDAPELKYDTIEQRKNVRQKAGLGSKAPPGTNVTCDAKKGNRSRLKGIQTQCAELFTCMGVPFVKSSGEAEALCAQLNQMKTASGVISEDSDCFLYGARTVYRNFNLSNNAGASVDVYQMEVIEKKLKLGRNKMIALSLLLGCDYQGKGVQGIGKESALKFFEDLTDEEILPRLRQWRTNKFLDAAEKDKNLLSSNPALKLEVKIRQKALQDPSFPSSDIIAEFLKEDESLKRQKFCWGRPSLPKFVGIAGRKLKWDEDYAIEKFLPVLTRWQLLHGNPGKPVVELEKIIKKRKPRGVVSYEISWKSFTITTVEPEEFVRNMFKDQVEQYEELNSKGSKKKKPTKKEKILKDISNDTNKMGNDQPKKTKAKNTKKTVTQKGIQTLDKFLVKLSNLSLHEDPEEVTTNETNEELKVNESPPSNAFQEVNYYDYADTYYYEDDENYECRPNEGNSSSCDNFCDKQQSPSNQAQLDCSGHLDESSLFRKLNISVARIANQSENTNNVSMCSCHFESQNTESSPNPVNNESRFKEDLLQSDKFRNEKPNKCIAVVHASASGTDCRSSSPFSEKCSFITSQNESPQVRDISMLSCDYGKPHNKSLSNCDSPYCVKKDNSLSDNFSYMEVSPVRTLNFESDMEVKNNEALAPQESDSSNSFAPKFSTPCSKSSHPDLGFKFETPDSGKKTWISKFYQKCAMNESITASDFECEADDIPDLSDIVENIVSRKVN